MTLDNASSNKSFIDSLKGHLNINKALVCDGEFIHIRHCAYIINLIMQDWLKAIDGVVYKICERVTVRKQKILECVKQANLNTKRGLR